MVLPIASWPWDPRSHRPGVPFLSGRDEALGTMSSPLAPGRPTTAQVAWMALPW